MRLQIYYLAASKQGSIIHGTLHILHELKKITAHIQRSLLRRSVSLLPNKGGVPQWVDTQGRKIKMQVQGWKRKDRRDCQEFVGG